MLALMSLNLNDALLKVNRITMHSFFETCKGDIRGSFKVHTLGETDLRCTFIVVLLTFILNLPKYPLLDGVVEYI